MIHVSCHHFVSQEVFQSEHEPLAFCCSQGKILIATDENSIKIHDLDSRGKLLHSFPSIDTVCQLIYCNAGNYIATLERKITSHSVPFTYVRIYFNWWIDAKGQPIKVRIAGTSTLPSIETWNDHFKMVELPLNKTAFCIACCKTTAALGVSLGKVVSVFCYNAKPSNILSHNRHDFSHFIDIEVSFIVQELNICKNYFACMSKNQVQVFKVCVEKESPNISVDTKERQSMHNREELDDHFVEWRFESCTDPSWENNLKSCLHKDSFPITVNFRSIEKENLNSDCVVQDCEIVGPVLTVKGQRIKVKLDPNAFELWPSLSSTNIDAVTLLYREFALTEKEAKLMSLHLVSFYESDHYDQVLDPLHAAAVASQESFSSLPWSSSNLDARPQLKAIGCFFSTVKEGFLYDVTEETRLIGSYNYTSNLRSAVLDSVFLHALTDAGLETYTLHLSHCAFQYVEKLDGVTNACPDFNSPICLLGLCPFLCASKLVISEGHLIVVSSLEESERTADTKEEKSCTLYILRKPSPQQVFSDLLEAGQMSKASSPSTYHLILTEGHMVLRTHLYLCRNYDPEAESLYRKSCMLLGDYYTCSASTGDKLLATPYYNLSNLSVEDVLQRVLSFQKDFKHCNVLKALVPYLNSVLLNQKSPNIVSISKAVAENILDIYLEESPENLWKVIFCSELTNYRIEKAMLMLKRRITSKRHLQTVSSIAADSIAIVSLLLKKGNVDSAQNMYLSISKVDLVSIIADYHELLWADDGLTYFGKFTKQIRPDAFIEMLLHMVKTKDAGVADVICMLKQEDPDLEVHSVPQLREFLEIIWNDCKSQMEVDTACQTLLVDIYLKRLSESIVQPTSFTKSSFTFGTRPQWLNEMPPFNGKGISRNCTSLEKVNEKKNGNRNVSECCCMACNEDLVKLQCLLIHPNASKELHQHVLEFLHSSKGEIRGYLSLEVLCLNEAEAVDKLLMSCPSAVFQFATDMFGANQDKWCEMFTSLSKKIEDMSEQGTSSEVYSQTFHKILGHLAEILSVPKFLSILPPQNQNDIFLPYVKRCCEKHQSRQLKNKIVALGNEIKAMM